MKVDYTVMGHDDLTSDFLNWCMEHRDNLEYQRDCKVMDMKSGAATLYFNDCGGIGRIDRKMVDRRHLMGIFVEKP